jgi:hypothetical protein
LDNSAGIRLSGGQRVNRIPAARRPFSKNDEPSANREAVMARFNLQSSFRAVRFMGGRLDAPWYPEHHMSHPHEYTYIHKGGTSMTNLSRLAAISVLAFLPLILAGTACSEKHPSVAEPIAKTYGLDSFAQIDAIRYTFNIEIPGLHASRSWVWEPKTGQVSYEGKDKDGNPVKMTYSHTQLSSQSDVVKKEIDPAFVNDQYWLVFPFHAYWDTSADVQDKGTQQLPLGNGSADLLSVKYPSDIGYTPGDTWDLYVGKDNRVEQLAYHRGGPKKPSLVLATWEGYKKAGPLLISTEHSGTADGKPLHLTFSDVAVKVGGSDNWVNAE